MIPNEGAPDREWKRVVRGLLAPLVGGYPFPTLSADPSNVRAGYTYFNSSTGKVRTWDGSAWSSHY